MSMEAPPQKKLDTLTQGEVDSILGPLEGGAQMPKAPDNAPQGEATPRPEPMAAPRAMERGDLFPREETAQTEKSRGMEKGKERRENLKQWLSKAFSGLNNKLATGTEALLASPEILKDTYNKIVESMSRGANRCGSACKVGMDNTENRIKQCGKHALAIGLTPIAAAEDKVRKTWQVPLAYLAEVGARRDGKRVEKNEKLGQESAAKYGSRIARLEAELAQLRELAEAENGVFKDRRDRAYENMYGNLLKAQERRKSVGHTRTFLEGLRKKAA